MEQTRPTKQSAALSRDGATVRCGCGATFTVRHARGRQPEKCLTCRRAGKKAWWARRRKRLKISDGIRARSRGSEAVSFEEIGQALKLSKVTVHEAYRSALLKLREGGGEALRDLLQQEGLNGLMEVIRPKAVLSRDAATGLRLLEYQMRVAELWAVYSKLVAYQRPSAALHVRFAIERFQKRIGKAMDQFLK